MDRDGVSTEIEQLLGGLVGEARAQRAELIAWLFDEGFSVEKIRASFAPLLLPADRVLGDDGTFVSLREVSESSGVEMGFLRQLHRAVGLVEVDDPDQRRTSRADAESVLAAADLVKSGIDQDEVVLMVRLVMFGLTRAAMMMRETALRSILHPGATELDLAKSGEELARNVEPLLRPLVDGLLRLALRHQFDTESITLDERATGTLAGVREVAVAFADLVDFTRLGETLPPQDLGQVAGRFALLAQDLASGPVQFVKTIGDAVMLVSADPRALLDTVFDLVAGAAARNFPRLRIGIAFGPAASRGGDWFGSPVNLASRASGVARADEILVADSVRQIIGDDHEITWAVSTSHEFKGIEGQVLLWRVERSRQE